MGHLEKAAATAERQIWKRAQAMSPQAPGPTSYFEETMNSSPAGGDVQWSMSSVEALDKMQKTYEAKIEHAKVAHHKEANELRKRTPSSNSGSRVWWQVITTSCSQTIGMRSC